MDIPKAAQKSNSKQLHSSGSFLQGNLLSLVHLYPDDSCQGKKDEDENDEDADHRQEDRQGRRDEGACQFNSRDDEIS